MNRNLGQVSLEKWCRVVELLALSFDCCSNISHLYPCHNLVVDGIMSLPLDFRLGLVSYFGPGGCKWTWWEQRFAGLLCWWTCLPVLLPSLWVRRALSSCSLLRVDLRGRPSSRATIADMKLSQSNSDAWGKIKCSCSKHWDFVVFCCVVLLWQ